MKKTLLLLGCSLVASQAIRASEKNSNPNFVLIIADDVSTRDIGCYGNTAIQTPNLDKLANNGVKFTNAFLTAASSSPTRASIVTGRWPHACGQTSLQTGALVKLQQPWDKFFDDIHFFPEILKNNGYYCAHSGKWHIGYHHAKPSGPAKRGFDYFSKKNGGSGGDQWASTIKQIPKDKPFFTWFAAHDAHRPFRAPKHTNPKEVIVPPYLPDTEHVRAELAAYYDEIIRLDQKVGEVVQALTKRGDLENTMIIFISDNGRPFWRSKAHVYDSGMRTPFIVHWPAKIKSNQVSKSLLSVVDIAPTLVQLAGDNPADYAFQGRSFKPILEHKKKQINKYVFSERNWHGYYSNQRAVRDGKFLYIRNFYPEMNNHGTVDMVKYMHKLLVAGKLNKYQADNFVFPRSAEELYDRENDPHQLHNLAKSPEFKKKLEELRNVIDNWRELTGDAVVEGQVPDWYDRPTMGTKGTKVWGKPNCVFNKGVGNEAELRKMIDN
jgi:arylsulfatase A-like enzyme